MKTFIRALALVATTAGFSVATQAGALLKFDTPDSNYSAYGISITEGAQSAPFGDGGDGDYLANVEGGSIVLDIDYKNFHYDLLSFRFLSKTQVMTYTVTDENDQTSQKGTIPSNDWVWSTETADLINLGLIKSVRFDITNRADFGLDNLSFSLSGTDNKVPEPASLALVSLALAGVAASRRRVKA